MDALCPVDKVRCIRTALRQQARDKRVVLACPTARAAMVLARAVGRPASTIHRLLEFNPQDELYKRNRSAP